MSSGQIKPGDLMAFLVATQTIQRSLAQFSLLFGHYVRGTSAGARIFEVIFIKINQSNTFCKKKKFWFQYCNIKPSIPLHGGKKIPFHSLMGDVEFRNVDFSYPTRSDQVKVTSISNFNMIITTNLFHIFQTILNNFSLKLPAGKVIALVGSSGGGKSTIAALLERHLMNK